MIQIAPVSGLSRSLRHLPQSIARYPWVLLSCLLLTPGSAVGQTETFQVHERGRIWEVVWNSGIIGDPGAWDYLSFLPKGMFPGFENFVHPCCNEFNAINTFANANMHNFRSGVWITARDLVVPGAPPEYRPTPVDYELYAVGQQVGTRGIENVREPVLMMRNFAENADTFNPLLPEEMTVARWHTNLGLSVTRRSYVWGFEGYRDAIVYDYVFKNTGKMVSNLSNEAVPDPGPFQQTLEDVQIAFHSGISVSTKSQINFHSDLTAVQAGAFGWKPPYHDFYRQSADRTLAYSYNYNGGAVPPPFNTYPVKDGEFWKQKFGDELMSPAAFGWLSLYATDAQGRARSHPRPDVIRIDSHKGGSFKGQDLDLQTFNAGSRTPQEFHEFLATPDLQRDLGNRGDRFNFYTFSYGPYDIAPGDSVRIIVAEVAGVMDYAEVIAGDPQGHFPDSTIAAIERNADLLRRAVAWGVGTTVDGMPLAADVPEPPPAPWTDAVNASQGTDEAAIAVTWDDIAERASIRDGAGNVFFEGSQDLDGYRIYRSTDFQYTTDTEPPAFRGAAWDLLEEVPREQFSSYFDTELGRYRFVDEGVEFGRTYSYYVSAFNRDPRPWTSANGTLVNDLPELASADLVVYGDGEDGRRGRSFPAAAVAGPVASLDVYAVPNPFVFGDSQRSFGLNDPYRIEFRNLPERADIRIFTIAGDLVRTIRHGPDERGNLSGTAVWDQKSDSGLLVAPGLYVYQVGSQTDGVPGQLVGKIMLIR